MSSLLREYIDRHRLKVVVPVDEGVCLFGTRRRAAFVALTSTPGKALTTCRRCLDRPPGLVLEVAAPDSGGPPWHSLLCHTHIHPDVDLWGVVRQFGRCEPLVAAGQEAVEAGLWGMFMTTQSCCPSSLGVRAKHTTQPDEPAFRKRPGAIGQMVVVARSSPAVFEGYYRHYHQPFLLNRRYMLLG